MPGLKRKIHIDFLKHSPLIPWHRVTLNSSPNIAQPETQQAAQDGIKDAVQEAVKSETQNREKLNDLMKKSENVLLRVGNIIPIFKTELVIDAGTVTIISRPFFFSEHIQAISIKNINDIFIQTVPFLATMFIVDAALSQAHIIKIKWFWKNDAEKARRIITGLMQASKEGIDLKSLEDDDLAGKMEEIGKVRATSTTVS